MATLDADVNAYLTVKRGVELAEEALFGRIRQVFDAEVLGLNVILKSKGYTIDGYRILPPNSIHSRPTIHLNLPYNEDSNTLEESEQLSDREIQELNKTLAIEYRRIEDQHGFDVHGFDLNMNVG